MDTLLQRGILGTKTIIVPLEILYLAPSFGEFPTQSVHVQLQPVGAILIHPHDRLSVAIHGQHSVASMKQENIARLKNRCPDHLDGKQLLPF